MSYIHKEFGDNIADSDLDRSWGEFCIALNAPILVYIPAVAVIMEDPMFLLLAILPLLGVAKGVNDIHSANRQQSEANQPNAKAAAQASSLLIR